ncbi:hypothetical protein F4818DRAFT_415808 [Hypoxylon cercidicola]|nr:hypothetical protein F4818DRAFT_415808 [Hypoxylon cercidicola]
MEPGLLTEQVDCVKGNTTRSNRVSSDLGADFGSLHVWGTRQDKQPQARQKGDQRAGIVKIVDAGSRLIVPLDYP